MNNRLLAVGLAVGLSFSSALVAADSSGQPPQKLSREPILRLDPERHTGWLKRISLDKNCQYLVTAGRDDKTTRLWQLPNNISATPSVVQKFRHPIGSGNFGKIYAVAISPDSKTVALGGWDVGYLKPGLGKNYVYVFDARSGNLIKRIGGFDDVIHHLAYSGNGRFLVAGLHDGQGIRLWNTANWSLIPNNGNPEGDVYGAVFDGENRLYTVAYGDLTPGQSKPGHIREFVRTDGMFKQVKEIATQNGHFPYSIAINPTNNNLAIGFSDVPAVEIYSSDTLTLRHTTALVDNEDRGRISTGVTWSSNGQQLFIVLSPHNDFGPKLLRTLKGNLEIDSPDIILPIPPAGSATQLITCNSQIFVGANEGFGIYDLSTKRLNWTHGANSVLTVDKGDLRHRMQLSQDGTRVAFSFEHGGARPVIFDIEKEQISTALVDLANFKKADTHSLSVSDWEFNSTPRLNGARLPLEPLETAMALAISPDRSKFVLGTEWRLHAYSTTGKELWCEDPTCTHALPIDSAVFDLNVSQDGQLVVSAHSDGTIRWRRMADGQLLLSLFVDKSDNNRWIAWTPRGYFTASVGGESLVGWHVNRGLTKQADFFPLHVFRRKYLRPDIVKLVLRTRDEDTAVAQANNTNMGQAIKGQSIGTISAPVIDILSPKNGDVISTDSLKIDYVLRSTQYKVTKLTVRIDGGLVYDSPFNNLNINKARSLFVRFPPEGSVVTITAYAGDVQNLSTLRLKWKRPVGFQPPPKPKLYGLVIGATADPLKWPDSDARDLVHLLQSQPHGKTGLYRAVNIRPPLLNQEATSDRIIQELTLLKEEMINEAEAMNGKVQDVAVIFYSGHGAVDDNGRFWLTPIPALQKDGVSLPLRNYGVSTEDLISIVENIPGRTVLLLDACRSGSVLAKQSRFNFTSIINDLRDVTYFYTSAGPRELSFECEVHGCFSEALISGLRGEADKYPPLGSISTLEVGAYLSSKVPLLRGGYTDQNPAYHNTAPSREFELFRSMTESQSSDPVATTANSN